MKMWMALVALAGLVGCAESTVDDGTGSNNTTSDMCVDQDGDTYFGLTAACPMGDDCNDFSTAVNPGKPEIPGNGLDDDCKDGDAVPEITCADADNDNFRDIACGGRDCDDTNPDIKPRAVEICGNGIDEDCEGGDLACAENCTDADNDGFGIAGSMGCPGGDEIDCYDASDLVFPGAPEICNSVDDNCVDGIDECALEGQVCAGDGGTCQGGSGAQCENNDDCAGSKLTCDPTTSPKLCKGAEDAPCAVASDCVAGLACENDVCTGNFCATNTCSGQYDVCYREAGRCVECPIFDPDPATQDAACPTFEQCTPGGWCAENWDVPAPAPAANTTTDIYQASLALAECWNTRKPLKAKDLCFAFFVSSQVAAAITETMMEDAYLDGDMDAILNTEQDDALHDMWGPGIFNVQELTWKADLEPGTAKEVCVWYEPGGFLGGEKLVIDRCENFAP